MKPLINFKIKNFERFFHEKNEKTTFFGLRAKIFQLISSELISKGPEEHFERFCLEKTSKFIIFLGLVRRVFGRAVKIVFYVQRNHLEKNDKFTCIFQNLSRKSLVGIVRTEF